MTSTRKVQPVKGNSARRGRKSTAELSEEEDESKKAKLLDSQPQPQEVTELQDEVCPDSPQPSQAKGGQPPDNPLSPEPSPAKPAENLLSSNSERTPRKEKYPFTDLEVDTMLDW